MSNQFKIKTLHVCIVIVCAFICSIWLATSDIYAQEEYDSIEGTVTDEEGNPLSDIYIEAYQYNFNGDYWQSADEAITNENGTYQLTDLNEGITRISFNEYGYSSEYMPEFYDNVSDLDSATNILVSAGETVTGIDAQLGAYPSISGRVTNTDGNPIPNVQVETRQYDPSSDYWYRGNGATTDADGQYKILGLDARDTRISFESPNYVNEYYDDAVSFDTATIISLAPAQAVTNIDAQLQPYPSIFGQVTNAEGVALQYIEVTAYWEDEDYYDRWNTIEAVTDETGTYTITGEMGESVYIGFYDNFSGYAPEYYDNVATIDLATAISVTIGENVTGIDAQLEAAASLSGQVTNMEGNPLPNIEVRAYWDYDNWYNRWEQIYTVTDATGLYTLTGPMAGDVYIGFFDNFTDYVTEYHENKTTLNTATAISVAGSQTITGIDAQMATQPTISGLVTDESGAPIADVDVTFYYESSGGGRWNSYKTVRTDESGAYLVDEARVGINRIRFRDRTSSTGYRRYVTEYYSNAEDLDSATDVVVSEGASLVLEPVQMAKLGSISGTVTDLAGNPIEAYVSVRTWNSESESWTDVEDAEANSDGTYYIGGLTTDSYYVLFRESRYYYGDEIYAPEYYNNAFDQASATTIAVENGDDMIGIDAQLDLLPIIQGTVTDVNGLPVEGASVSLYAWDDPRWSSIDSANTDSNGLYSLITNSGLSTPYRVCVNRSSAYLRKCYDGAENVEFATDIIVNVNETISDINVTVTESSKITGTVRTTDSEPLEYFDVNAYRYEVNDGVGEWVYVNDSYTEFDGSYTIDGLYAGEYRLQVQGDDMYQTQFYTGSLTLENATTIEIGTAEAVSNINLTLLESTYIAGKVTDENGHPLERVPVGVYKRLDGSAVLPPVSAAQVSGLTSQIYSAPTNEYWELVRSTRTSYTGRYAIRDLPTGSYRIGFSTAGSLYHREFYGENAYYISQATDIVLEEGTRLEDISVQLAGITLNVPPMAVADEISVAASGGSAELAGASRSLLSNDEDAEGKILTALLVSTPSHGTLALNVDGTFVYQHDGSNNVTDSFSYKVSDGQAESIPVTVTIKVMQADVSEADEMSIYLPTMHQ